MLDAVSVKKYLERKGYIGRGIIVGKSPLGKAVMAYFISGRSENSKNRVFSLNNGTLTTKPFDESKVKDPSLILYSAMKQNGDRIILSNGDHTEDILSGVNADKGLLGSLSGRTFEPDFPHFTPRISALITFNGQSFDYDMSVLKSSDEKGSACDRFLFSYSSQNGVGHFIHTYDGNGDPLPSFTGEPRKIIIPSDIDEFTRELWQALDERYKISLFVRYADGAYLSEDRIINVNVR